ncbi:hypothetical protein [Acuticoccus kandeliae]|uniref:hypothetical protein n=1 Tax=Acuticoccus kandeliae TaxID=2073160 RepID=UPI000D3E9FE5|nr:hypothetical protein [Acuticoccus kandeliae]
MTTIVKTVTANTLPDELRASIDPSNTVRVTVEDLGLPPRHRSADEVLKAINEYRSRNRPGTSLDEAVNRIRELRDEWD